MLLERRPSRMLLARLPRASHIRPSRTKLGRVILANPCSASSSAESDSPSGSATSGSDSARSPACSSGSPSPPSPRPSRTNEPRVSSRCRSASESAGRGHAAPQATSDSRLSRTSRASSGGRILSSGRRRQRWAALGGSGRLRRLWAAAAGSGRGCVAVCEHRTGRE